MNLLKVLATISGMTMLSRVTGMLREILIARIAPVSRELILSHIAEKALGLPKSY